MPGARAQEGVRAQDADSIKQRQFQEQYEQAESAYAAQNYAVAADKLRAAFAIEPVPLILFNIAQAYRKLYLYGDARVYYELYRATAKDLPPAELSTVDRHIAEMRELERAAQSSRVVEKTKLLYLQSEKPPPRWMFPVGLTTGIAGLGVLAGGISLLSINGHCSSPAEPPSLECPMVYNSNTPGVALTIAGGGLTALGVVLISLSAKRPQKPVLTETRVLSSEDSLLPLLQAQPPAGSAPASNNKK